MANSRESKKPPGIIEKIQMISASAGTGKTYTLVKEIEKRLTNPDSKKNIRPDAIIATTFTSKAAAELKERVRSNFFKNKQHDLAALINLSSFGTVHSVCDSLIRKYSLEAGISPGLEVIPEGDNERLFKMALSKVLSKNIENFQRIEALGRRFGKKSADTHNWNKELQNIIDSARANNISAEELEESRKYSLEFLNQILPTGLNRNLDYGKIYREICSVLDNLPAPDDTTKATEGYVSDLRITRSIFEQNDVSWKDIHYLGKKEPGKKSSEVIKNLKEQVEGYQYSPQLKEDLTEYINHIFTLAKESLHEYVEYKKARGLIDFNDMENIALNLLSLESVRKDISENLDLLVVDEFQDTNPMQLALFLKLGELAKETIWVGDPKQTIFAFRGSDPELMQQVIRQIPEANRETLSTSYRTLPEIVNFNNALFENVFSGIFSANNITTGYDRKNEGNEKPLKAVIAGGSNKELRSLSLAKAIREFLNKKHKITDKTTKTKRTIEGKDIGVLCRSNDECRDIARNLAFFGIPSRIKGVGLGNTAEAHSVMAALKVLVYPADELSRSELYLLLDEFDPEGLLKNRFNYLDKKNENNKSIWLDDHPLIQRLMDIQQGINQWSPSEAVDVVINALNLRRQVQAWPDPRQRLANIEALRQKTREYEETTRHLKSGASVAGFLLYLDELSGSGLDETGASKESRAVDISTYHSSKGLEWPATFVYSLDQDVRGSVFGIRVLSTNETFNITDPLAGRKIRYLPWPFGDLKKIEWLKEHLEAKGLDQPEVEREINENKRLLYVGLTRARDFLVFALSSGKSGISANWVDMCMQGNLPEFKPDQNRIQLGDQEFDVEFKTYNSEKDEVIEAEEVKEKGRWILRKGRPGEKEYPKAWLSPSVDINETNLSFKITGTDNYAKRINITGNPEMNKVGDFIHALICFYHYQKSSEKRKSALARLLENHGMETVFANEELVKNIEGFFSWLETKYPGAQVMSEHPLLYSIGERENLQRVSGIIDMLVETKEGYVIIDHKSFPGKKSELGKKALEYAPQLEWYKRGVEQLTGKKVIGMYIHFVMQGEMVEVG